MQDITEAVDFVGNTVALLGIHGKENYIFYCKFIPKYFFLIVRLILHVPYGLHGSFEKYAVHSVNAHQNESWIEWNSLHVAFPQSEN